jgi:hypothetical protein
MQKIVVTLESENSSVLLSSVDMPELDRDKDVEIKQLKLDLAKANAAIIQNALDHRVECDKLVNKSNEHYQLFKQNEAIRVRQAADIFNLTGKVVCLNNKITNALDNLNDD